MSATAAVDPCVKKYVLRMFGIREPTNAAMIEGKRRHEEYLKNYAKIVSYAQYLKMFWSGSVTIQEQMLCSSLLGYRGIADILQLQKTAEGWNVVIVDLKSGWQNKYVLQLVFYGHLLAQPHANIIIDRKPYPLWPDRKPPQNINLVIRIFDSKKDVVIPYLVHGRINDKAAQLVMAVQNRIKEKRRYHGVLDKSILDRLICKCKHSKENQVTMQSPCQQHTNPTKTRQMHIGRKHLLVKTRPHIKLNELIRTSLKTERMAQ